MKNRIDGSKKTVHVALPAQAHGQYKELARQANMPLGSYLMLIMMQNLRTPLYLQGGLRDMYPAIARERHAR